MGGLFWSVAGPNDADISREETVNGWRIVEFKSGGVRSTKGDAWGWSYPGNFEKQKAYALSKPSTDGATQ